MLGRQQPWASRPWLFPRTCAALAQRGAVESAPRQTLHGWRPDVRLVLARRRLHGEPPCQSHCPRCDRCACQRQCNVRAGEWCPDVLGREQGRTTRRRPGQAGHSQASDGGLKPSVRHRIRRTRRADTDAGDRQWRGLCDRHAPAHLRGDGRRFAALHGALQQSGRCIEVPQPTCFCRGRSQRHVWCPVARGRVARHDWRREGDGAA